MNYVYAAAFGTALGVAAEWQGQIWRAVGALLVRLQVATLQWDGDPKLGVRVNTPSVPPYEINVGNLGSTPAPKIVGVFHLSEYAMGRSDASSGVRARDPNKSYRIQPSSQFLCLPLHEKKFRARGRARRDWEDEDDDSSLLVCPRMRAHALASQLDGRMADAAVTTCS
ncbi:hypothetical protein B0H19DRAFT_1061020 [Mycena capillaripes]|nr:hypothetical protein B0H19DRAFT_1061020 [Mycena capillaripes]